MNNVIRRKVILHVSVITVCQAQPTCSSGIGQCRTLCNVWEEEDKQSHCGAGCKCCVVPTKGKTRTLLCQKLYPYWCSVSASSNYCQSLSDSNSHFFFFFMWNMSCCKTLLGIDVFVRHPSTSLGCTTFTGWCWKKKWLPLYCSGRHVRT